MRLRASSSYAEDKRETIASLVNFVQGRALPRWPSVIFLEVSNVCNMRCAMCSTFSGLNRFRYINLRKEERGFIDFDGALPVLDLLLRHALLVNCFGFGEPTVHPGFGELLRRVASYDVLINFFTNGMHLSPDLCDLLVANRVSNVTVSFSGTNKKEYENVYLGASYEQVLEGIRLLSKTKKREGSWFPIIEINSLSFRHHIEKLDDFVDLMADHGANVIHLKALETFDCIPEVRSHAGNPGPESAPFIERARKRAKVRKVVLSTTSFEIGGGQTESNPPPSPPGDESGLGVQFDETPLEVPLCEWKIISESVAPIRPPARTQQALIDLCRAEDSELDRLLQTGYLVEGEEPFYCLEPFLTFYVRQNGSVKPCCFSSNAAPSLGHVGAASGVEIWTGKGFSHVRKAILEQRYPRELCSYCLDRQVGPRYHALGQLVQRYLEWYQDVFGSQLIKEDLSEIENCGSNSDIIGRYLAKHLGIADGTCPAVSESLVGSRNGENDNRQALSLLNLHFRQLLARGEDTTGFIEAHIDGVIDGLLIGWIACPSLPDLTVSLEVLHRQESLGCVRADQYRPDLEQAGMGSGHHGFRFEIPGKYCDGRLRQFTLHLVDTPIRLSARVVCPQAPPGVPPVLHTQPHLRSTRR